MFIGAEKARLVIGLFRVVGTVVVMSMVWLLVLWWACIWVAMETALCLALALGVFLAGNGCHYPGGGRPPGEGMATLCLVNLPSVRGGCYQQPPVAFLA